MTINDRPTQRLRSSPSSASWSCAALTTFRIAPITFSTTEPRKPPCGILNLEKSKNTKKKKRATLQYGENKTHATLRLVGVIELEELLPRLPNRASPPAVSSPEIGVGGEKHMRLCDWSGEEPMCWIRFNPRLNPRRRPSMYVCIYQSIS